MALKLYESLSRSLRELRRPDPTNPADVFTFYNCGPTVYAPAHIGNFRTAVVNDVIRRLLELEFGPTKVKHVRNLTDVDDRTIAQALKKKRPLAEITQKWTEKYQADSAALNCLIPHVQPTATGHIKEQVSMIEVLMEKGNAYRGADGSVYFKIDSFPEYGALSRIKDRELKITDASADSDHKDSVSDFALWKAYKPSEDGEVKWPGPKGAAEGRPGWHIECSAMIKKHLGDTIDLHTGGVDLLFPHHENEIAQSNCCNGVTFARHWYHSEHLLVDGTSMSKSKGNYYTLSDLVEKGYSPMAVRYALLAGHPRKQLNFTLDSLHAAEKAISGIRNRLYEMGVYGNVLFFRQEFESVLTADDDLEWGLFAEAWELLKSDLNMPAALGAAFSAISHITDLDLSGKLTTERWRLEFLSAYRFFNRALGIDLQLPTVEEKKRLESDQSKTTPDEITALAEQRWAAKQAKDFATADKLRAELTAAGWTMLDRKDGYSLEPLKKA
jgi:cysteinyl-tRNA synthetase